MASVVGRPEIQAARAEVTQARGNMNTRFDSSKKLVTACNYFEKNHEKGYFDKSQETITKLVNRTASLSGAIATLEEANVDIGTCKVTIPGRLWGTRKVERPVAEVNQEIESNLGQEVVQAGLRTLGIIEQPKAPLFTMPERPDNSTLLKAGVATAVVAGLSAAGYAYSDSIFSSVVSYSHGNDGFSFPELPEMPSMPEMPTLPSMDAITKFFSDLVPNFSSYGSYGQSISEFVSEHYITLGVGTAVTLLGAAAIYQAVQHYKKEQVEEQAPELEAVVTA